MSQSQPAPSFQPGPTIADALAGTVDVAGWVRATARQHGVAYAATLADTFAAAASRLSDAEVRLDPTEALLLALERAGIVSGPDGVRLHAAYLRQKG